MGEQYDLAGGYIQFIEWRYQELKAIIAILGMDELSKEDKLIVVLAALMIKYSTSYLNYSL